MKLKLAATSAITLLALSGCAIPEDDGTTAADRSEINTNKGNGNGAGAGAGNKPGGGGKSSAPEETAGQENARKSAENYLDLSPFSRDGLIKQLKFEGFSEKDAAYGVDAQKADWNKQAAAAAQNYLDLSSFSRDGLITQLKFEGFTQQQAEFGVNKTGL